MGPVQLSLPVSDADSIGGDPVFLSVPADLLERYGVVEETDPPRADGVRANVRGTCPICGGQLVSRLYWIPERTEPMSGSAGSGLRGYLIRWECLEGASGRTACDHRWVP